jgi:hypothetical protein
MGEFHNPSKRQFSCDPMSARATALDVGGKRPFLGAALARADELIE